jgi:hypothetical protein
VLNWLKMQHGGVSYVKWACVLSRNEMREIVMDSDSEEDKYYASQESEDEEEPCQPSQQSSISWKNGRALHSILWTKDGTC